MGLQASHALYGVRLPFRTSHALLGERKSASDFTALAALAGLQLLVPTACTTMYHSFLVAPEIAHPCECVRVTDIGRAREPEARSVRSGQVRFYPGHYRSQQGDQCAFKHTGPLWAPQLRTYTAASSRMQQALRRPANEMSARHAKQSCTVRDRYREARHPQRSRFSSAVDFCDVCASLRNSVTSTSAALAASPAAPSPPRRFAHFPSPPSPRASA